MLKLRRVVRVDNVSTVPLLDESTNFAVKSVKVDNYSGHWMRIDPDGVFVPPFTVGMLIDLFVEAQRVGVYSARPPGIGLTSSANELDGIAIISAYDDPVFPFPGTFINPPYIQRIPAIGNNVGSGDIQPAIPGDYVSLGIGYSFPLFWAAADNNENNEHVQARQNIDVQSGAQVCAAGVTTAIAGIVPDVNWQRIMWLQMSVDTSGVLLIDYSSGGFPLFRGFIMAGIPAVIPFHGNGFFLNGSGASRFRANHDVGAAVYLTVGMGHS